MILAAVTFDPARIWVLPLLWGLVIYSFVSGYSIRISRLFGWRIISRKTEPVYFWFLWGFHFVVVDVLSYLLLVH